MRRLAADYQLMRDLMAQSSLIESNSTRERQHAARTLPGHLQVQGIVGIDKLGRPKFGNRHQVHIYLHNQYPQRWPGLQWMTPIWHPNIHHLNGTVLHRRRWWTASRSLDRLVIMLGEMVHTRTSTTNPPHRPSVGSGGGALVPGLRAAIPTRSPWTTASCCIRNASRSSKQRLLVSD